MIEALKYVDWWVVGFIYACIITAVLMVFVVIFVCVHSMTTRHRAIRKLGAVSEHEKVRQFYEYQR